jgi:hypothetical protein
MKVWWSGAMTQVQASGGFSLVCLLLCANTPKSYGLPTRSRLVSEFMIGLEKIKAKAGEVSQSARALSVDDMHWLYDHCMNPGQSNAEKQ